MPGHLYELDGSWIIAAMPKAPKPAIPPDDFDFGVLRGQEMAKEVLIVFGPQPNPFLPQWVVNAYRRLMLTMLMAPKSLFDGDVSEPQLAGINTALLATMVRLSRLNPPDLESPIAELVSRAMDEWESIVSSELTRALGLYPDASAEFYLAFGKTMKKCASSHGEFALTQASGRYLVMITYWRELDKCASRSQAKRLLDERGLMDTISDNGWTKLCDSIGYSKKGRGRPRKVG